jgi:hypothetical protein
VLFVDVPFEKRTIRRILVDVALLDVDLLLLQKTSGVTAGRSSRFPVKRWFRHRGILPPAPDLKVRPTQPVARPT